MQRSEGERLATLEADMRTVKEDVSEVKGDVKTLLGYFNAERGIASYRARIVPWVAVAISLAAMLRAA